jgi:GT2 family glycosyltransferase
MSDPELNIVIVNFNSTDYLEQCVSSIERETQEVPFHITIVDNASEDRDFSNACGISANTTLLQNESNLGFSVACNQGIRHGTAPFYLLLNPDCVIKAQAISRCIQFLKAHPEAGIVGCRVKNPDGTLQRASRRSIPRPSVAFYRFSGLSFIFPKNRRLAAYNLSHMDVNQTHEVEAVSGSFLLFRHEVLETAGYLDEAFFLYGEDLDFCYRASLAGWKVFYYPGAEITHFKRGSSSRSVVLSNYHFYNAMEIFYRKHFYAGANILERFIVLSGIRVLYLGKRLQQSIFGKKEVGSRN